MSRVLSEFSRLAGGELRGVDRSFASVSSDSRTLTPGDLFVALSGPNFDGHHFVAAAAAAGAVAAVVSHVVEAPIAQVLVDDPLAALQRVAAQWRARHPIPVVGVAGSNGKTTTKELIAAILAVRGPSLATRGNLNNHIGVPLTLMRLGNEHRSAVIEMGANACGDIAALVPWVAPTVGVVTNAGAEHLEGFVNLDGVAAGEGELFEGLPAVGTAVINADDEYANYWRSRTASERVLSFGLTQPADFTAQNLQTTLGEEGFQSHFTLVCPAGSQSISLALGGTHNVHNALAAAAAAFAAGASLPEIRQGLAAVRPVKGRLQPKRAVNGARLIDDSYNANPSSVLAGFAVLSTLPGERWLVLGDMGELGANEVEFHRQVALQARQAGIARLYAIGSLTVHTVEAFGAGAQWFNSAPELAAAVSGDLHSDVTVLIKGSRLNRLERVVDALLLPVAVAS